MDDKYFFNLYIKSSTFFGICPSNSKLYVFALSIIILGLILCEIFEALLDELKYTSLEYILNRCENFVLLGMFIAILHSNICQRTSWEEFFDCLNDLSNKPIGCNLRNFETDEDNKRHIRNRINQFENCLEWTSSQIKRVQSQIYWTGKWRNTGRTDHQYKLQIQNIIGMIKFVLVHILVPCHAIWDLILIVVNRNSNMKAEIIYSVMQHIGLYYVLLITMVLWETSRILQMNYSDLKEYIKYVFETSERKFQIVLVLNVEEIKRFYVVLKKSVTALNTIFGKFLWAVFIYVVIEFLITLYWAIFLSDQSRNCQVALLFTYGLIICVSTIV